MNNLEKYIITCNDKEYKPEEALQYIDEKQMYYFNLYCDCFQFKFVTPIGQFTLWRKDMPREKYD